MQRKSFSSPRIANLAITMVSCIRGTYSSVDGPTSATILVSNIPHSSLHYGIVLYLPYIGRKNSLDGLFYHNGMQFSTKDMDNDLASFGDCAKLHKGGWWFKHCMSCNLNGMYYQQGIPTDGNSGILWTPWKGSFESLKTTEMKIRPRSFGET